MKLQLTINANTHELECAPGETLFSALRRLAFYGVKFGDDQGLTGADTIILDGKPVNSSLLLAAQAEGHAIVTIEGLGEHPDQGWRKTGGLHPLQQAFVESGAIQCGYCTPAQILTAKALLDRSPNPTEAEVRDAISGVLCRCTGYIKPVQAVLRAAAVLRGEAPPNEGKAMLALAAVLTWQDIPRVLYSTAGQSDPIPGPLDAFSLDKKVRFVGDRVAFVAAETPAIAEKALSLIEVEYEVLQAILDPAQAMKSEAVKIHDEPEYVNFADSNPQRNLAAEIRIDIGDVAKGFAEADEVVESVYEVPKGQQVSIEPHVCITYWDEDDRLVIPP